MLKQELLSEVIRKALSNGGEYADVFVEWRRSTFILLEDMKIEKVVSGIEQGAGIRLIFGGKTAYAFTNDLSEKALLDIAGMLSSSAAQGRFAGALDLRTKAPNVNFVIKQPPDDVPISRKIGMVKAANDTAMAFDSRIKQASVLYRDSAQNVQMATSEGEVASDERIHTVSMVNVVAVEDGLIQTGYEAAGGLMGFELFDESPLEAVALKASRRAAMMLGARRAPGGRMPVVISSEAGGTMIHEAIGHGLEADLSGQGLSVFSGKMGQEVASRLVSVIDDATLPNKRGSFRFDDEANPSERTVLVKDGVLVGYMYDRLSAMREGAKSTGNGRRESYMHRPMPRMSNTLIAPGNTPPREVLKATERGLFVRKMGGGQVDTVTGDFVFDVLEGYLIEGGAAAEPVRGATLTGNGPAVLMAIDMVSSDLGFSIGTCGKDSQGVPVSDAMPTIRIPEMVVGGEV
ncbi:MAG: TldD/PmbA family protein [Thermodesulfovibrionales bacterium]|nr:TldD/PmbA family protein [Thermodesulfovibrionales bacterium]